MSNNNSRPATPQETEVIRTELERRHQTAPEIPCLVWKDGAWAVEDRKPAFDWDPSWHFVILSK